MRWKNIISDVKDKACAFGTRLIFTSLIMILERLKSNSTIVISSPTLKIPN